MRSVNILALHCTATLRGSSSMKKQTLAKVGVIGLLTVGSQVVYADADIAVQDAGATALATTNVDLCVTVPTVLIFGVGDVGATVSKLNWTFDTVETTAANTNNQPYSGANSFTGTDPFDSTVTAEITTGVSGTESTNQVALPVFVFSNSGDSVLITSSVSGGPTGGPDADVLIDATTGTTIPISSFSAGASTAIQQPALVDGSTATVPHASGIVNTADTWTYSYSPSTIPAAGFYEARVTYVASTP